MRQEAEMSSEYEVKHAEVSKKRQESQDLQPDFGE